MGPSSECAVLVPCFSSMEPETEQRLDRLRSKGYAVRTMRGASQIDLARSVMATRALRDGFKETFWIDADMSFDPDDVDKIRQHGLPFTAGVYVAKGPKRFACKFHADSVAVTFGVGGGLTELEYAAGGFTHVRAEVYAEIAKTLPACKGGYDGETFTPYFLPLVVTEGEGVCYLSEDFSFCYRAKGAGFKVMADTTIKVGHVGRYTYTWDDLVQRQAIETLNLQIGPKGA